MTDVTQILSQIQAGDEGAVEKLLPLVYDELRRLAARQMAGENPGHTLQATALVHEAYLRLVGEDEFENRGHFFASASEAMRRILVDQARRKQSLKRGGDREAADVEIDQVHFGSPADPLEVLAVHEALEQLAATSPRRAELVKLRYFLGCTVAEAAEILGIAPKTAEGDWTYARAWLRRQWHRDEGSESREGD